MGRNARRRAEERDEKRSHGLNPDEEKAGENRDRCPRCGSAHLVTVSRMSGTVPSVEIACVACGWQGSLGPGMY